MKSCGVETSIHTDNPKHINESKNTDHHIGYDVDTNIEEAVNFQSPNCRRSVLRKVGAVTSIAAGVMPTLCSAEMVTWAWEGKGANRVPSRSAAVSGSKPSSDPNASPRKSATVSLIFITYTTKILINYDENIRLYWRGSVMKGAKLLKTPNARQKYIEGEFAGLSASVANGLADFPGSISDLAAFFVRSYGVTGNPQNDNEFRRQLGILFSLLPPSEQPPASYLDQLLLTVPEYYRNNNNKNNRYFSLSDSPLDQLLPTRFIAVKKEGYYVLTPEIPLWEKLKNGGLGDVKNEYNTVFGPTSTSPLYRSLSTLPAKTYGLFALSGGLGCALTHSAVIPLDVVKTRLQTEPQKYEGLVGGAIKIAKEEGKGALFLGAQATIAGYLWYGVSVYPSYELTKRVLSPLLGLSSGNISLLSGSLAAVIASFGLTPIEAARIRTVAEPNTYREIGLAGTLAKISAEGKGRRFGGWTKLYDGLPPLMLRQILFGTVKFFAFDLIRDFSFSALSEAGILEAGGGQEGLKLLLTFASGGAAGVLSSVVSQPADSILTYISRLKGSGSDKVDLNDPISIVKGFLEESGAAGLFNGLGSRCIWSGSIIGGQFFLYEIFRNALSVGTSDLVEQLIVDFT